MNMDAAHYINTIRHVAPITDAPASVDFAILDLAYDEGLLAELYSAINQEPIHWVSLFENTAWQAQWKQGPVVIDLRQCDQYRVNLIEKMGKLPIGLLLKSNRALSSVVEHCREWMISSLVGDTELLRFQEPRMFGPLMCVLSDDQRSAFLSIGEAWVWHDTHEWRIALPGKIEESTVPLRLTDSQLKAASPYRLAAEAGGLSHYYKTELSDVESPQMWVLERLFDARDQGFRRSVHLERWLRLSLQIGADFYLKPPFKTDLGNTSLSLTERLNVLESHLETTHA